MKPQYLGDAVYIQFDEGANMYILSTDSHKLRDADQTIWLEPSVMTALINYKTKLEAHLANEKID